MNKPARVLQTSARAGLLVSSRMYVGEDAVNRLVQIYWLGDKKWFKGRVVEFRPCNRPPTHLVKYDDGDQKEHDLEHENEHGHLQWVSGAEIIPTPKKRKAAASSAPAADRLLPDGWTKEKITTHTSWYYLYSGPGGARTNSYTEAWRLSGEQPHPAPPAPTPAKQRSSVGTSVPQQQPRARPKPRPAETQHGAAAASSAASSSECRQFWQAGNYSSAGASRASSSVLYAHAGAGGAGDGLDRARTHPKFLHSNATSHKWAIGAIAELIDNSYDEMETLGVSVPVIDPRTSPVRFAAHRSGFDPAILRTGRRPCRSRSMSMCCLTASPPCPCVTTAAAWIAARCTE